ncbi:MAG TPA: Uma2 family endonuclease [Blastocatellia bacterium]|nr:Uma2 family endonuclease [Blastocatellia bacterium]
MSALRKLTEAEAEGAEERLVFYNLTWDDYEKLLEAFKRHPGVRLTYCEGALEIMVVSFEHEKIASYINSIIETVAVEWEKDYLPAGSTTFRLKPEERGFEPDGCFYFTHIRQLARKTRINLLKDPAPDLAVEVDISSPSVSRFPIFARLGVKEVWRYHQDRVDFHHLRGETYIRRESSKLLPGITAEAVTRLIDARNGMTAPAWQKKVRELAQEHRPVNRRQ